MLGLSRPGEPAAERLYAVVVPNEELLRERKVANVGDLMRFEMEGASVHLPHHKRVLGYEIWTRSAAAHDDREDPAIRGGASRAGCDGETGIARRAGRSRVTIRRGWRGPSWGRSWR